MSVSDGLIFVMAACSILLGLIAITMAVVMTLYMVRNKSGSAAPKAERSEVFENYYESVRDKPELSTPPWGLKIIELLGDMPDEDVLHFLPVPEGYEADAEQRRKNLEENLRYENLGDDEKTNRYVYLLYELKAYYYAKNKYGDKK